MILGGFRIDFGRFLGGQDAPKNREYSFLVVQEQKMLIYSGPETENIDSEWSGNKKY